ncbi:5-oxoprolinase subunit PxpB [Euzebyella saccharophila]|uniref:5-oxoprolinase subunit PxpB n=1 Tax=Euzebyella saccharophila TaxID=679664 RepID=A0ABV8JRV0_9FLAO|nr:5-oxoprolinase subunit PxpB [Euzebyella saccharophila]
MNLYSISIRSYGPHAILIEWPNRVEEAILENILHFTNYLKEVKLKEDNWEMVPAYNSVTLIYRDAPIDFKKFKAMLIEWYADVWEVQPQQRIVWKLPVCYHREFGIDLDLVSEKLNLTPKEIIQQHTSQNYTLYGIGFLPGFMYLGGLPTQLEIPRRSQPRAKVEKGSVGLAGKQTGIYPQLSPGGWNIIGNCPINMFNVKKEEPCFIKVGDKVQFYEIEKAEHDLYKIEEEVGIYKLEKEVWHA